jgi:hypothetical protein
MRIAKLALPLLALALLGACSSDKDNDPVGPPATTGVITGTVTVAPGITANLTNARVAIYESLADWEVDAYFQETYLAGSPPRWSFNFQNVTPGTYFIDVCVFVPNLSCYLYQDNGRALPVQVAAGQSKNISITFRP